MPEARDIDDMDTALLRALLRDDLEADDSSEAGDAGGGELTDQSFVSEEDGREPIPYISISGARLSKLFFDAKSSSIRISVSTVALDVLLRRLVVETASPSRPT